MCPRHLIIALDEIGITEVPGPGNNPKIAEYLKAVDLPGNDAIPHCAAFVNWCLGQAGVPGTRSALARSFLNWGFRINKPQLGCVVVLSRGTDQSKGHVGFYMDSNHGFIKLLGGNQGDRVGINEFGLWRILEYRWHAQIQ
jgi:uncharacterized protein (TIGR02594 family)